MGVAAEEVVDMVLVAGAVMEAVVAVMEAVVVEEAEGEVATEMPDIAVAVRTMEAIHGMLLFINFDRNLARIRCDRVL